MNSKSNQLTSKPRPEAKTLAAYLCKRFTEPVLKTWLWIVLFAWFPHSIGAELTNQFVTVRVGHNATISVPRSWDVVKDNDRVALDTTVGAAIDLTGYARLLQGSESLLVANFPDPDLYAGLSIVSTPINGMTPNYPDSITPAQYSNLESVIRQGVETLQAKLGEPVWGWSKVQILPVGTKKVMLISYYRKSQFGTRHVYLYKYFSHGRIFDIALSTSTSSEVTNRLILERIAASFQF